MEIKKTINEEILNKTKKESKSRKESDALMSGDISIKNTQTSPNIARTKKFNPFANGQPFSPIISKMVIDESNSILKENETDQKLLKILQKNPANSKRKKDPKKFSTFRKSTKQIINKNVINFESEKSITNSISSDPSTTQPEPLIISNEHHEQGLSVDILLSLFIF
jgi:hypothetical protein